MRRDTTRRAHRMKNLPTRSRWRALTTSTTSTAGQLKRFGASLAEVGVVHEADGLLLKQVFGRVRGGGEA